MNILYFLYMVSVIILSFNTKATTLKCLEYLYLSRFTDFETIVVDNASSDGSAEAISSAFPQVRLIKNIENVGFAKGNNFAMSHARGSTFLLLNSDAFVFYDTLGKVVEVLESEKNISIIGCQLLNADGTIQPSWGYFPTLRRVVQLLFFVDNLPVIKNFIDSIHVRSMLRFKIKRTVDWVTGAFILLKREVFENTGGFDEKFFMYGEETEWLFRCNKAGYKTLYTPRAQCVHIVGASSPNRAPAITGEMSGWVYWFEKHNKPWQVPILLLLCYVGCWLRVFLKPNYGVFYRQAAKDILQKFRQESIEQ